MSLNDEAHSSTTATLPTSTVSQYGDYLRMVYLRSKLPIKGKWPPSPCKKIIKLAAIERKGQQCQVAKFKRLESVDEYMQENNMKANLNGRTPPAKRWLTSKNYR